MNSDRHSPRRRNMSRSPHYGKNNADYNERSVSPHRRYSAGRRSPSSSPHQNSYKAVYRTGDSDYSDDHHSRNSRRSYSSESDYDYYARDKERGCEHGRGKDRDRDRSRSREYRDRHHHKDRDYRDRDRDRFRRDKGRDRRSTKESRKSRDRDRSYRDDDRDSTDGRDRSPILSNSSSTFDTGFYKNQPPNNTIMIRGLAQHITENDVRQDIINCGLMPKDIRLIRKKDTGASRGFAFVEFSTLQEAMRWMEMKQVSVPRIEDTATSILAL